MNTNEGGANIMKQETILLDYLRIRKNITRLEALMNLHIANAPEIIRRLKAHGHPIRKEWETRTNGEGHKVRYARYYLEEVQG